MTPEVAIQILNTELNNRGYLGKLEYVVFLQTKISCEIAPYMPDVSKIKFLYKANNEEMKIPAILSLNQSEDDLAFSLAAVLEEIIFDIKRH